MKLIVDEMPKTAKECDYAIFNRRMDEMMCKLSENICGLYSCEKKCNCLIHIDDVICRRGGKNVKAN